MKIGLTYTGTEEKHENYVRWLKGAEQLAIIKLRAGDFELDQLAQLDGLVLSGGIDLHPMHYHNDNIEYPNSPDHFDEGRDAFEMALFQTSQSLQIPVLGVCRGMQLVNCALGGTLTQDIGLEANIIHRYDKQDKSHGINILSGTLLQKISGVERSVTNSAHHQAIQQLGKGLVVNCQADDGIVEGVEWADKTNKPFFLGIQWHPERLFKFSLENSPLSKNIRDRFIQEIIHSISK